LRFAVITICADDHIATPVRVGLDIRMVPTDRPWRNRIVRDDSIFIAVDDMRAIATGDMRVRLRL
jgi:hypothetical protein